MYGMNMKKWIIGLVLVAVLTSTVVTVAATPKDTTAAPALKKEDIRLETKMTVFVPFEPQITGALGGSLYRH